MAAGKMSARMLTEIVCGAGAAVLIFVGMIICYYLVVGDLTPPGPAVESPSIPIRKEDMTGPKVAQPGGGSPGKPTGPPKIPRSSAGKDFKDGR